MIARLREALALGLPGLVLLRLLVAVADLPAVCKVRSLLHVIKLIAPSRGHLLLSED
jgi:hypothetical protein